MPVAFFDFRAGNRHHIVVPVRVEAGKLAPKVWIARVEVAKMARGVRLSPSCGKNCTLYCSLARLRVEPFKLYRKQGFHQILARARVETVKMARGIYSPRTTKNPVWMLCKKKDVQIL